MFQKIKEILGFDSRANKNAYNTPDDVSIAEIVDEVGKNGR